MPHDHAPSAAKVAYRRAIARMRRRAALQRWHRWLGLAALPFVLLLVITGLLLEFSVTLSLDRRTADSDWLKRWYGMATGVGEPVGFQIGADWLIGLGDTLYLNAQPIAGAAGVPIGAVATDHLVVVATDDMLLLLTTDGELIEKVGGAVLPGEGPVEGLAAATDGGVSLGRGGAVYRSDPDVTGWDRSDSAPAWSTSRPPPSRLVAALAARHRTPGPSWERVLLDLHSGRLLGRLGPWLMDIAAGLLGFLALSGLYNAIRRQ